MKKIISFFVFSFLAIAMASAQGNIKFGLTGGLINSDVDVDLSAFGIFDITSIDAINKTGFYIGAFADIEATDKLHVQPEITYGSAGDLSFVFIPVMAKYYVASGFNIQAGPQLNFSTNLGDIKDAIRDIEGVLGTNADLDDVLKSTGVDLAFGAGYDISDQLFVQARYAIELSDRYSGPIGSALDIKGKTLYFGVGYSF